MAKSKKTPKPKKNNKPSPPPIISHQYKGTISIVIPLYNEIDRVGLMAAALKIFEQQWKTPAEIILVNDGSSDATLSYLQEHYGNASTEHIRYQVLDLGKNQGKGKALKEGVLAANGDHILTLDADMAASPTNLLDWLALLENHKFDDNKILIASREHQKSIIKQDGSKRKILGNFFNYWVQLLTGLNSKDTQCGFKLYPKEIAKWLFGSLSTNGWAHDVELLHKAHLYDIEILEMPIKWQEVAESKVAVWKDGINMGLTSLWIVKKNFLRFFWVDSIRELKNPLPKALDSKESPIYRFLFILVAFLLLFLMPYLSFDYGITADEGVQEEYGRHVLEYFESGKIDDKALTFKNLYLYGGIFDYTTAWWHKYVFSSWDVYEMRHMFNALIGFLLMVFTGLLAKSVSKKWSVGFFAILLIALSPRIFGHAMNNPKDIPFAAGYIISLFFMLNFVRQLPRPSVNSIVGLIVGIAITINVRVGGILLLPYLFLFTGGAMVLNPNLRPQLKNFSYLFKLTILLGAISLLGYLGGAWYWPFAQEDRIGGPLLALSEMSNFSTGIRMIWEGKHQWSEFLPWYYIPKWLVISTPIIILIGAVLALLPLWKDRKNTLIFLMTIFAGIFPIAYTIYKESALYDAMRHFLFIYPILVLMAAYGIAYSISIFKQKSLRIAALVLVAGLLFSPVKWMIQSHPNQYTYFNEIAGGIDNVLGVYETDYWMNSTKEACNWAIENIPAIKKGEDIRLATQAYLSVHHYFKDYPNVKIIYTRYHERDKYRWDYGIYVSRFANRKCLEEPVWPAGNELVYAVKAGNTALCMVSKRSDISNKSAEATKAFKEKDVATSISLLQEVLAENPKDESALLLLTQYALQGGQIPLAKQAADSLNARVENYSNAAGMLALCELNLNEKESAKKHFEQAIESNIKYTFGHFHLARLLAIDKNYTAAITHLELFDKYGGNPANGYDLAIQICEQLGNTAKLNYFTAKKLSKSNNWRDAIQKLNIALSILPDYAPAVEMQKNYNNAVDRQQRLNARNERLKLEGKIK